MLNLESSRAAGEAVRRRHPLASKDRRRWRRPPAWGGISGGGIAGVQVAASLVASVQGIESLVNGVEGVASRVYAV